VAEDAKLGAGLTCFVIGPIGSKLAPFGTPGRTQWESSQHLWENLFEPACDRLGLTPLRADKIAEQGEITEQIFVLLRDADIVIADLSGGNPNVMYELGLRHTRDKITLQVGEYERLPFDINTIRTIQFRRTEAGLVDAREALVEALTIAIEGRGSQVAATRLWNEVGASSAEALADAVSRSAQQDDTDPQEDDAAGFIDVLAEGEESIQQFGPVLESATAAINEIGGMLREVAGRIQESDANRGGFAGRLKIANELANNLGGPAGELEDAIASLAAHVEKTDLALTYIFDQLAQDPSELGQSREVMQSIIDLATAAEGSMEGTAAMTQFARQLKGMARGLIGPANTLLRALGRYSQTVDVMSGWKARAEALSATP